MVFISGIKCLESKRMNQAVYSTDAMSYPRCPLILENPLFFQFLKAWKGLETQHSPRTSLKNADRESLFSELGPSSLYRGCCGRSGSELPMRVG